MDLVGGSSASCSPNRQSEPPPGGRSATSNSPRPQHAFSSSLAPPSQASDVDIRQVAGFTSQVGSPTSTVRRFPALELGHGMCDMRGMDLGACEPSSTSRHQVGATPAIDSLLESSEISDQWDQLMPDEAFERYFELDNLDSPLFDYYSIMEIPKQPQFINIPDSDTPENSESSGHCVGDLRISGDRIAGTTSCRTSTVKSPGKRCRERTEAADDHYDGVAPSIQQERSIDILEQQKQMDRGPKIRPDKSNRYTVETPSEVDVVEDGYRWRKYGQKPVKNSAHPRSYYRCTTLNCPVKKQVERCNENSRNVLTTYDGTHNHPGNPGHSAREPTPPVNARGNAEEITLASSAPGAAPVSHHDGLHGPRWLSIPSNYIPPHLLGHMLTSAFFESGRWPNPAPPPAGASVSPRNIDLLRMHQFFMLQYQTQYPLLSNPFNLLRNYFLARPPVLDPSLAIAAAQNLGRRSRQGQGNPESSSRPPNSAFDQHASRSASLSRAQQQLLWMQQLMGEKLYSESKSQQASEPSTEHHEGVENLDLGDP